MFEERKYRNERTKSIQNCKPDNKLQLDRNPKEKEELIIILSYMNLRYSKLLFFQTKDSFIEKRIVKMCFYTYFFARFIITTMFIKKNSCLLYTCIHVLLDIQCTYCVG